MSEAAQPLLVLEAAYLHKNNQCIVGVKSLFRSPHQATNGSFKLMHSTIGVKIRFARSSAALIQVVGS